jgi:hypothetical protein
LLHLGGKFPRLNLWVVNGRRVTDLLRQSPQFALGLNLDGALDVLGGGAKVVFTGASTNMVGTLASLVTTDNERVPVLSARNYERAHRTCPARVIPYRAIFDLDSSDSRFLQATPFVHCTSKLSSIKVFAYSSISRRLT